MRSFFPPSESPLVTRRAFTALLGAWGMAGVSPAEAREPPLAIPITSGSEPLYGPYTYERTLVALQTYEELAGKGGWRPLPNEAATLKFGASGPVVKALKAHLSQRGDLAAGLGEGDTFDVATGLALRKFQARHGLSETGMMGRLTLKEMNVPAEVRVGQLLASLQRLRGNGFTFGERYVVVNIPGAAVEAVKGGMVERRHVAVVGRKDRPSPVLEARITNINLNPTWTAPLTVVRHDIMPKVFANPAFLAKSNMKVLGADGQELDPASIDWSGKTAPNFTIRQEPGLTNALGVMRIDMPNVHAVYLHDTPKKELFRSDIRFQSSGCARVSGVKDLAMWLLEGTSWDRLGLEVAISSGERLTIKVPSPVPIAWVYLTAWALSDGTVHFRDDIYGLDNPAGIVTSTLVARRAPIRKRPDPAPDAEITTGSLRKVPAKTSVARSSEKALDNQ